MSTRKKDIKEDVTGRAELLKGPCLLPVSPESCKPDFCEVNQETALLYKGCSIQRVLFIWSEKPAGEGRQKGCLGFRVKTLLSFGKEN